MVNKQSVSPPIPHLHALLTSGDKPPEEVDLFDLLKVSYEVSALWCCLARRLHGVTWVWVAEVDGCLCFMVLLYLTESLWLVEIQQPEGRGH